MTVDEVLKQKGHELHSIEGTASIEDAARALRRANSGCIAVVLGGRVTGLVGERQITRAIAHAGKKALSVNVQEVMSRLCICKAADDLASIGRRMQREGVRHIAVLDDDAYLVGILSIGDVLRRRLSECQLEVGVLRDYARTRRVPARGAAAAHLTGSRSYR